MYGTGSFCVPGIFFLQKTLLASGISHRNWLHALRNHRYHQCIFVWPNNYEYPAVTLCPQKPNPFMPYDFSGLFSPMEFLIQNECIHRSVFSQLWKPHDTDQSTMTTLSHLFNDMNQTPKQDGEEICVAPFADLDIDLLRNGMITFEELVQSTPNKDLLVGYVKSEYAKDVNPSSIEKSILHCSFNEEPCRDT
ncbi:unnamed protein product [Darwinula stevensoni]|uniref:Uncharacterized protein n=1 Tax=Darwinula stevensoni TaxID=69355 RepID=A0A7R9FRU4_9CRUS|nr:unnamed protein product [Darwinula stevensoni]CAG0902127.1 unnamed protein product [Darwinula stevensoni]